MKNHKELCLLGAELLDRFSDKETYKITADYKDELVAISYSIILLPAGHPEYVCAMINSAFMLGYEAGKNSKAGDFNPGKWAVAEND